jgi:D-lysine oxidase
MKFDCIVLGAGMVGVSTALHLIKRGRSVALVDRRSPVEETSYGNAGIIQTEGVMAYTFPRELNKIVGYALNLSPEARLHYSALPELAPWLYQYWRHGSEALAMRTAHGLAPLIGRCLPEHEALAREAGAETLLNYRGYLKLFRKPESIEAERKEQAFVKEQFGVPFEVLDAAKLLAMEPHISGMAGGIHLTGPVSVSDPGTLGKAYAQLFDKLGGEFLPGDARSLAVADGGWQLETADGRTLFGREVVISLGPWSRELMEKLGRKVLLRSKRGYHMHYALKGNATLSRPVLDADTGYVLAPMRQGIRLTTGAEFAKADAPPSPVQLDLVEPVARKLFPLAERLEDMAWFGRRPCLPDLLPMIGRVPGHAGLWANFGHQHLGFTLGPVTGRLLAEMLTGETPFADIAPYRVDRF